MGCHTDAYEQAKWFGDDIALKHDGRFYDSGRIKDSFAFAWHTIGAGRSPLDRARVFASLPLAVRRDAMVDLANHWQAADALAQRLGLGSEVQVCLRETFSRWDGKGGLGGAGVHTRLIARLVILATARTSCGDSRCRP